MRYDAAIFDLDGTLADTLEDIADAMNHVLGARGFPVHACGDYRLMIGKGLHNLVTVSLPPEARGAALVAAVYDEMIAVYGARFLVKTRLYDGVADLIGALRADGLSLAVYSNKADELTRRIVAGLFPAGAFAAVVGARAGFPLKPDPAVALRIAADLAAAPARIVYLGDSGTDMRTATAAGMVAVGVSWGFRDRAELVESGAQAVLDHPRELLTLVG